MEHDRSEEQLAPAKETITQWTELVERLATPARYPRFPELTAIGDWRPWSAEPNPQATGTTAVERPKTKPSRFHRWRSNDHRYCRTIQYQRLPEGYIRLLDLQDAKIEDGIMTGSELITVPLSKAPKFEAISYCWGSTDLCTGSFVKTRFHGKQVCRVTENLATCLHSIVTSEWLHMKRPDYIWIDQLCINQDDLAERSVQVRLMADIYKTATGVIVWLGQKSDFDAGDFALELQPEPNLQWRGRSVLQWIMEWSILARPWFFRQWIFQEAVFAKRITILLGSTFTSWDDLLELSYSLDAFLKDDFLIKYGFLIITMNTWLPVNIDVAKNFMISQGHVYLPSLMQMLQRNKCQDPRDKVFSLVGFAGDILPANFVDYGQSVDAVVQRCTRCLIEATGDLGIIRFSKRNVRDRRPSWVPLWHEQLHVGISPYVQSPCASKHRVWKPPTCTMEDQLVAAGKAVDSIAVELFSLQHNMFDFFFSHNRGTLGQPLQDSYDGARAHFRQVIKSADDRSSLNGETMASLEYRDEKPSPTFIRKFIRAVFCDDTEISASERDELFDVLTDESRDSEYNGESLLAKFLRPDQHPFGRLLLLESGRLAYMIDPDQIVEPGDCVTILHGLNIPCLLRKVEDDNGWLIVTTVYIDGMMQGEAVDWEEDEADTFILV